MTATQVFMLFLKETCTLQEYMFFREIITKNHGNKYFSKKKLYKNTFVEDYLSRNNRALDNFITRLFVLAPNLCRKREYNPRWQLIVDNYNKDKEERGQSIRFMRFRSGMYVEYYRREWNKFLKKYIEGDKKIHSPFKKGERYEFKIKKGTCDDTYI